MQGLSVLQPSERIVDAVHTAIRDAILKGVLTPGEQLSVPELSRRLNVSRSPVREAVLQLVAEGLAVEQPRRGVIVATIDARGIGEIYQIRVALETLAARLAASSAQQADIDELRDVLDHQAEAVKTADPRLYSRTDLQFHAIIGRCCENTRLQRILEILKNQVKIALERTRTENPDRIEIGWREHAAVLTAIENRDPDAAESAMRRHMEHTREEVAHHLRRRRATNAPLRR
jgi:DNA-binding GntR family transcriptional regulator